MTRAEKIARAFVDAAVALEHSETKDVEGFDDLPDDERTGLVKVIEKMLEEGSIRSGRTTS